MNGAAFFYLILTVMTGILWAFILPFNLHPYSRLLISPALGCIFLAEITLLVSLILGFQPLTIWLSLTITLIAGWYLLQKSPANLASTRIYLRGIKQIFFTHWPFWFMLSTVGSLVVYMFLTKVLTPSPSGLVTGGGGLYGDTAMHASYTMSMAEQGLPPSNPLYAGKLLIYPFLVNFFSAMLVKLGLSLRLAFVLPQLGYFLGFLTLFYLVAKKLTNNLAVCVAQLTFFFGWGMGFLVYIQDGLQSGSWSIIKEYTNNLPGFFMHNVLTGLIFPERSFLPGLFIGLLITVLTIDQINHKTIKQSSNLTIGVLLGILPLWHTHTFIFFSISIGMWLIISSFILTEKSQIAMLIRLDFIKKVLSNNLKSLVLIYGTAGLLAMPVIIWFSQHLSGSSFIHFSSGWQQSTDNFFLFWWKNIGLVLPLAIIGLVIGKNRYRQWFFLPIGIIFVLANFIMFQPWDWDNIKLFSWVFLFLSILAGSAVSYLWKRGIFLKPVAVISLIMLISSGILSVIHQATTTYTIYDNQDLEMADWIKKHTLPDDVFLIDPQPTQPIGLTGRSVYLGYPGHLWVHGIDYGKREAETKNILDGNQPIQANLEVSVNYLITSPTNYLLTNMLSPVYQNQKYVILKYIPL